MEGRILGEAEVVVFGEAVVVADGGHDLGLLDGVDAEVGLELEVGLDLIAVVAGLLAQHLDHHREGVVVRDGGKPRATIAGARRRRRVVRTFRVEVRLVARGPGADGPQLRERLEQRPDVALFRVVRKHRGVWAPLKDVGDERRLRALRTDLDEHASSRRVHLFDERDELDRRGDLLRQQVADLVLDASAFRVEVAGDVGEDRRLRRADIDRVEVAAKRLARRGDHLAVERVADGEDHDGLAHRFELRDRLLDGFGEAGDDRLLGAILVGAHDVAVDLVEHRLHVFGAHRDARHQAVVAVERRGLGHRGTATRHGAKRLLERHHAGGDARAILAEAVAGDHRGADAEVAEQAHDRDVRGQHRGLRDLGLCEARERTDLVGLVRGIDDVAERLTEERRHDRVCLGDRAVHGGEPAAQVGQHPEVLGALAGEQHRDLRIERLLREVDALIFEEPPALAALEPRLRAADARHELIFVAVRDREANVATRALGFAALYRQAVRRGSDETIAMKPGREVVELRAERVDRIRGEAEDTTGKIALGHGDV